MLASYRREAISLFERDLKIKISWNPTQKKPMEKKKKKEKVSFFFFFPSSGLGYYWKITESIILKASLKQHQVNLTIAAQTLWQGQENKRAHTRAQISKIWICLVIKIMQEGTVTSELRKDKLLAAVTTRLEKQQS